MLYEKEALKYHREPRPGKIEVVPLKPCLTQADLSLAYTPGVAVPCLEIRKDPDLSYEYTSRGNLIAVITNGTAVLGLGNIGPLAGKPVMEGKGVLFKRFADCTVNVDPNAEALAEIAILSAEMAHFFGMDPRVAMLSFSNFGNARQALSDKVARAVGLACRRKPGLAVDGEMHADTALREDVLHTMFPFNRLGGSANVLVFPDLGAGNIAYKLLEQLGGATAAGPMLMGLSKPFNVLPRNTDMENVVNVITITVVQAGYLDYGKPLS